MIRADERLDLARRAYSRAVASARAEPTPTTWRRLLMAARNFKSAGDACERKRAEAPVKERGDAAASAGAGGRASRTALAARVDVSVLRLWKVRLECESLIVQSRQLMEQSRKLVAQSRALSEMSVDVRELGYLFWHLR